ncbi:MAG: hypothetical protein ACYTF6_03460 [Planctomycetota bacterium]|jgi:hypothetical protein
MRRISRKKAIKAAAWILACCLVAGGAVWLAANLFGTQRRSQRPEESRPNKRDIPPSPAEPYEDALAAVSHRRAALAESFRQAVSPWRGQKVINEARDAIFEAIYRSICPYWYGTRWAFHGTTQRPREGTMACGYFVSTLLRDAGFRVERVRLAQQAAEKIIKTLISERHIRRFSGAAIGQFVEAVKGDGKGIYIVGLDYHVGLVVCEPPEVFFIHSSGLEPWCVVKEPAMTSPALVASRYRVYGKLTADDELIERWLLDKPIPTQR